MSAERLAALEARLAAAEARIAKLEQRRNWPDLIGSPVPPNAATPNQMHYDRCPCNPANGGSGVCNCIMGGLRVTC